jgi:hypothetical protein
MGMLCAVRRATHTTMNEQARELPLHCIMDVDMSLCAGYIWLGR